jgi:hypothetical protein
MAALDFSDTPAEVGELVTMVGYAHVGDLVDVDEVEGVFKNHGYLTAITGEVIHVSPSGPDTGPGLQAQEDGFRVGGVSLISHGR